MIGKKPIVCLLTDFGLRDGYVAAIKGVIYSIAPDVNIIDISHEIDPFSISSGAYVLYSVVPYFPPDTVFVAVVDPGVGTDRRGIIIRSCGRIFIGPDNGLFSWVLTDRMAEVFSIDTDGISSSYVSHEISSTFHGRDIFAPLAARIAMGADIQSLAMPTEVPPIISEWITPGESPISLTGQVIHIDRFGNIVTNITKELFSNWRRRYLEPRAKFVVEVKSFKVLIKKTYGEVPEGELIALWGSSGHLEISVNRGHAANRLSLSYMEQVRIRAI